VDAVHYGPHGPIDVQAIDCDFLVCSAYKFYGPHLGLLYGRRELLQRLRPFKVRPATDELPSRWETGTPNLECLSGLLGTFEYLASLSGSDELDRPALARAMGGIREHERALAARLVEGLQQLPDIRLYGITDAERFDQRAPTVSLTWTPHQPEALARWLSTRQIFTWHGDHYATELMRRLGLSGTRFDIEPEITGRILRLGYRIHEVPIDYYARSRAEGKKLTWKDGVFSSWNGHSPFRLPPPAFRSATYSPTTCSMRLASRTRSLSASEIRPATLASV